MKKKPKSALENQTFWIYALVSFSKVSNKKACYIGQTVKLARRLKEHYKNNRVGKSSYHLHVWAEMEATVVSCVVLSKVIGNQQEASVFENYWFKLAKQSGFFTPNSASWANSSNSKNFVGVYKIWPEVLINSKLIELTEIVEHKRPIQLI